MSPLNGNTSSKIQNQLNDENEIKSSSSNSNESSVGTCNDENVNDNNHYLPLMGDFFHSLNTSGHCFKAPNKQLKSIYHLTSQEKANWLKATSILEPVFWPLKQLIASGIKNITLNVNSISPKCKLSLELFTYLLFKGESVSYQMMDSFGSFGHSIFTHGISSLGDYSQCINLKFNNEFARYTMIQIHSPLPKDMNVMSISKSNKLDISNDWKYKYSNQIGAFRYIPQVISICLPSQCSTNDIEIIINSSYIKNIISPIKLSIFSSESKSEQYFNVTTVTTVARITVLSVIIFTIIATYVTRNRESTSKSSTLAAFDIVANSSNLMADPVCDERLHFFSGYKAIYLFFCTIGHATVPLTRPTIIEGIYPFTYISSDSMSKFFSNATGFVITTNFVVTACLSMIAILPEVKRRKGNISIVSLILVRALRTLPTICAYIILVFSLPWITTSNEPLDNPVQKDMIRRCTSNWWRELLFISNTVDIVDTCHQFAWFISADMQIAIVSSVSIVLFYSRPVTSFALIVLQLIASMILQHIYLDIKGITPKLLVFSQDANSIWVGFRDIYVKTVTYVPSYSIGLIFGILMANSIIIKNINTVKYLMILSVITCLIVTSTPSLLYTDKYFYFPLKYESIYAVLSCATHSLTIGTFIYCVYHYPKNLIVKFFSSKPFIVISRLTFSAFIVQPLILLFNRKNRYSSLYQMQDGVFNYIVCLLFGYLMYITIEAPFYNLTKFIFKSSPKQQQQQQQEKKIINDKYNNSNYSTNQINGDCNNN